MLAFTRLFFYRFSFLPFVFFTVTAAVVVPVAAIVAVTAAVAIRIGTVIILIIVVSAVIRSIIVVFVIFAEDKLL